MKRNIFVLGAAGYIGKTVVIEALEAGWKVKALVRTAASAKQIKALGAEPVTGDIFNVAAWIGEAKGCQLMLDLIQPKLPGRLGLHAIRKVAAYRLESTRALLEGLKHLPENDRPLLVNVSGVDDLAADKNGKISDQSSLVKELKGFAHIGVPVRKLIESAGVNAVYVYLGTVYGPGKAFADAVIPRLIKQQMPVIGSGTNHMALIHVEDAARALIHLGENQHRILSGSSWVVTDGTAITQAEFFDGIAALLNAKKPRRVPRWLASIVAGCVTTDVLSRESCSDPSALLQMGFKLRYPDWRRGVPQMLKSLSISV